MSGLVFVLMFTSYLCAVTQAQTRCDDSNCAKCDIEANPQQCIKCKPRYGGLSISGTKKQCKKCAVRGCVRCPENIEHCYECKSRKCKITECSKLIPGCLKCTEGKMECQSCAFEWFIKSTGLCGVCPMNCLSCVNDKYCTSCRTGYGLVNNNNQQKCELCSDVYCDKCPQQHDKCEKCLGSRLVEDGKCVLKNDNCYFNVTGCAECKKANGSCSTCSQGYRPIGNNCEKCTVPGCAECPDNKYDCTKCDAFKPDCQLTVPTPPLCPTCNDPHCTSCPKDQAVCMQCEDGYLNKEQTSCQSCRVDIPNCLKCSSSSVCTQCDPGYSQVSGKCQKSQVM